MKAVFVAATMFWAALHGGAVGGLGLTARAFPDPASVIHAVVQQRLAAATSRGTFVSPWDGRRISREAMARVL